MPEAIRVNRRAIGTRAGLTLKVIVDAARSLSPDAITMQAVADALGVDRKAVNHHVTDRETLLSLVAMDVFATSFADLELGALPTWQEASRVYARGFVASATSTGVLAEHIRMSDPHVTEVLKPTEALLGKLVGAGFGDELAMRSLALLTNICIAYARDRALENASGVSPRPAILRKVLETRDLAQFSNLARLSSSTVSTYDDAQLDLSIEVFIAGIENQQRVGEVDSGPPMRGFRASGPSS